MKLKKLLLVALLSIAKLTNEVIRPSYCIKTQFKLNYIKVFKNAAMTNINSENTDIFIKISGIWQTDNVVGITFKFI